MRMAASARFFLLLILLLILLLSCSPRPQGQRPEIPQPGAERVRERRPELPAKTPRQPCQGGMPQVPDHAAPLPVNRAPCGWGVQLIAFLSIKVHADFMLSVGGTPALTPALSRSGEGERSAAWWQCGSTGLARNRAGE